MTNRRKFIKNTILGSTAVALGGSAMAMPASSYRNIIGANDRLNVAIAGLGRRVGAFYEPVGHKQRNVRLSDLCDVMEQERTRAMENVSKLLDYKPTPENDIRKVIDEKKVDVLINATPDH